MKFIETSRPSGNRLLDALSEQGRGKLLAEMTMVPLRRGDILVEPGRPIGRVYFPLTGVTSLVTPLSDGFNIDAATIGNEGMVGVQAFLGDETLGNLRALGQIRGEMLALDVDTFRAAVDEDSEFRRLVRRFVQVLLGQIAQNAACNVQHEIRQRAAKWLLRSHDRIESDLFELTQEFLAEMLGVARPSLSAAARSLQNEGLITYRRGWVSVLDREGLERASCECYAAARREYDRLLGDASRANDADD